MESGILVQCIDRGIWIVVVWHPRHMDFLSMNVFLRFNYPVKSHY